MDTTIKSADLRIRLEPEHRDQLSRLAAEADRSLSDYVRRILTAHIETAA